MDTSIPPLLSQLKVLAMVPVKTSKAKSMFDWKQINETLSWSIINLLFLAQCCISNRNKSFDLRSKTNYWFLYEMRNLTEMA